MYCDSFIFFRIALVDEAYGKAILAQVEESRQLLKEYPATEGPVVDMLKDKQELLHKWRNEPARTANWSYYNSKIMRSKSLCPTFISIMLLI